MIGKMLKSLLFALGLALSAPSFAQTPLTRVPTVRTTPADADPALWVVRDEDTIIYLFGTFHMLDGRPWFNDEVRTAFDASSELVLEAVMPEEQGQVAATTAIVALDSRGRPLAGRLPANERQRLERALTELGLPATLAAQPLDPWFVALSLTVTAVQRAGLLGTHGAENVLSAAARERNMPIGELESFEWQLRMLDGLPEELQLVQLRSTLDELPRLPRIIGPALDAWSRGDVEALDRVLDDPAESDPRLRRILLADRNANWVRWIRARMARPGTVFVAVGAGHLAGRDSVQTMLGRQGIRAERVPQED